MEQNEWLVFSCRACRGMIKLSAGLGASSHVICPSCRTKVSVPIDATVIREDASPANPIPSTRHNDGSRTGLRGRGREEWERGSRQTGGNLDFRSRLSTSTPSLQKDAPDQPEVVRVNLHRKKLEETATDFDDPEQAEVRRRRKGGRGRGRGRGHHFENQGVEFNKTFVRGLVIAVVLLAGTVGWLGWKEYHKPKPEAVYRPKFVQARPDTAGSSVLQMQSMADYVPALKSTIQQFVSAPSVDAMLPLVRDRARVEPKIRAFYNAQNPWQPLEINNKFEPTDEYTVEDDFIVIRLILSNYDEKPITLERNGSGFLVDWESFTGYGELPWADLKATRPAAPVLMRVILEKGLTTDFFDGVFSDQEKYRCYRLRDAKSDYMLSGYTTIDSPADREIQQYLKRTAGPAEIFSAYAVIRLRYPQDAANDHQVEITEFLQHGWVFRPKK